MTAREWFERAQKESFAIGAFNVDSLEIFKAICEAGKKMRSPVMVEFSQGEVGYFGLDNVVDLIANARAFYQIPILLNLDHAKSVDDCLLAINATVDSVSFDDVHFDGSELSFEDNVQNTKKVVVAARDLPAGRQVLVEGEIDKVAGSSEVHTEEVDLERIKEAYTKPERAAEFVQATGVDILATVFGNVHGVFPTQPDLDMELLQRIRKAVPDTFLSLHGGSGIPAEQVKEAINVGKIVKVNINTEIRQAYRDALSEKMAENPQEYAVYKIMPEVILAVSAVIEAKIEILGSAGRV